MYDGKPEADGCPAAAAAAAPPAALPSAAGRGACGLPHSSFKRWPFTTSLWGRRRGASKVDTRPTTSSCLQQQASLGAQNCTAPLKQHGFPASLVGQLR